MRSWLGKYVDLLFRVLAVTALGVFLALPEAARAHPEVEVDVPSEHERSHQGTHEAGFSKISGHCHPGLDCFVNAVLNLQPAISTVTTVARVPFSFIKHSRSSWMALFEPPPPRARS